MAYPSRIFGGATQGLGRMASALASAPQAEQQGFDAEQSRLAKLSQALAQVKSLNAAADAHDAQAANLGAQTEVLNRRPGLADLAMAASAGVDVPTLNGYRQKMTTGRAPQVPMGPPDENGGMGVGSMQFAPEVGSKLAQAMVRLGPVLNNEKDLNPEQYAKGLGIYRNQDLEDEVMNGQRSAGDVGRAQAATSGKPLFKIAEGYTGDLFSGDSSMTNPVNSAQLGFVGAKTKEQVAAAADKYASAKAHTAAAGKATAETDQITNGPKGKFDPGSGMIIDERGATARPVIGQDGAPIGAKLKDIPPPVAAKIMEGRQSVTNLDNAIAAVKANPGAFGIANAVPGVERLRQGDQNGVDARAQVANIGSLKLHDRSGAAVSASEFPRLAPFIPSSSDDPVAIVRKLQKMKEIAESEMGLFADFYGPDQGFKAPPKSTPRAPNGQKVVEVND